MDVTAKLQIKPGQRVATLAGAGDVPAVVTADAGPPVDPGAADVIVAFARNRAELTTVAGPAVEAARRDKLAWIAYPKAGKLGTDLNRDILAALLTAEGVQPGGDNGTVVVVKELRGVVLTSLAVPMSLAADRRNSCNG